MGSMIGSSTTQIAANAMLARKLPFPHVAVLKIKLTWMLLFSYRAYGSFVKMHKIIKVEMSSLC